MRQLANLRGQNAGRVITVVAAAICIALGVFVVSAFTTAGRGEERPNSGRKELSTPTSLASLVDNPSGRHSVGAIVYLNNVQLSPGPSSNIFIARDRDGRELFVRTSNVQAKLPKTTTMADVSGVVVPLPSAANLRKEWKLDKKEAERAPKDGVYIEAERIKPEERRMQANSQKPDES